MSYIDPQDIDPDTGRPYSNYSSPSLDTSFHDHEMDVDTPPAKGLTLDQLSDEWRSFCEDHDLPEVDAQEMLHEDLTDEQRRYVSAFIMFWDVMAERPDPEERPYAAAEREAYASHDEPDDGCTNPRGHKWAYSGSAYGGDDDSYHGEGRCYCEHCGADGDA